MHQSPDAAVELYRDDPVKLVRRLKKETGMDIWLCGGSKLAAALAPEINELIVKVNPVVIGTGIPLFDDLESAVPVTMMEHHVYPNGFMLARYILPTPMETDVA
jgi:dihydrofolate reductase